MSRRPMAAALLILGWGLSGDLGSAQTVERFIVSDRTTSSIRSFNVADGVEVSSIRTGPTPDHVAVSPNGRLAFVANLNGFYLSVIDLTLGAEIARIPGLRARHLALNAAGTRLVAPLQGRDEVAVIDTSDFSILGIVSLDGLGGDAVGVVDIQPGAVVVVGNRAFVNPLNAGRPIFAVDLGALTATPTAAIPGNAPLGDSIAATPDGAYVVATRLGPPSINVIDTSTLANVLSFSFVFATFALDITRDSADPDGIFAYLVTTGPDGLQRVRMMSLNGAPGVPGFGALMGVIAPLPVPNGISASEISLTADSSLAYVVPGLSNASPNAFLVDTAVLLVNPAASITPFTINSPRLTGVSVASVLGAPRPDAPVVAAVSPTLAVNDTPTTVRVFGSNFDPDARVRVGISAPIAATFISNGELEITVPPGTPAQGADLIVTNPNPFGPVADQHLSGIGLQLLVVASPPTFQPVHQVLVANFGEGSLSVLNMSTNASVAPAVPVGPELLGVTASPDGLRAFTNSFTPPIAHSFDIVGRTTEASFPFGAPGTTAGQAGGIRGARFPATGEPAFYYVEAVSLGGVSRDERLVVRSATPPFGVLSTIGAGVTNAEITRGGLAVTPDGRYAYHDGLIAGAPGDGRIIVFDIEAGIAYVRPVSTFGVFGFQGLPYITPDGAWLFLQAAGGMARLFDIANDPLLTGPAAFSITAVPPPGVSGASHSSFARDGNLLYSFDPSRNVVYVFNFDPVTPDFTQLAALQIPATPGLFNGEIALTPDGSLLYVLLREDEAVAVIDTTRLVAGTPGQILTRIRTGLAPTTLAVRPGLETPTGSNVAVQPIAEVAITFDGITTSGETSVAVTNTSPVAVPSGFQVGDPPIYFEISTTATFSGPIEVCFTYNETQFAGSEASLRILHEENGVFVDRTASLDTVANRICALVDSFSAFVAGMGSRDFLFDSLLRDIAAAVANQGVRRSLQAKIVAARAAAERGQPQTAFNLLDAFKAELGAVTGVHITEAQAQQLASLAQTLAGAI